MSKGLSIALCRIWAGLDCGLWGAIAFSGWLTVHSLLRGEYWWSKFNVAAAVFYGDAIFGMGAGRATIAGIALLFVVYSALGVLYGLAARTRGFARNLMLATLFVLAWHLFAHRWVWRWVNPFAPPYFPPFSMLAGHLMFGLLLSRFAGRFQAIARVFGDPDWAATYLTSRTTQPVEPAAPQPAEPPAEPAASPDSASEAAPTPQPEAVAPAGLEPPADAGPRSGSEPGI